MTTALSCEDTFEEVAEDTRVPLELLVMLREAMGSAEPTTRDRVREHEMPVIRLEPRADSPCVTAE